MNPGEYASPAHIVPVDDRPARGAMPIEDCLCWNHMTVDQRRMVSTSGFIFPGGYGGGPCDNRAEVRVPLGIGPGDRFYCRACARQVAELIERLIP